MDLPCHNSRSNYVPLCQCLNVSSGLYPLSSSVACLLRQYLYVRSRQFAFPMPLGMESSPLGLFICVRAVVQEKAQRLDGPPG